MPNYYHDAAGRFATRDGQLANIQAAIQNKDVQAYLAERKALEDSDSISGYSPFSLNKGVHPALSLKDEDIAERTRVLTGNDRKEIEYFMAERADRPEFRALLAERDSTRDKAKRLNEEYKLLVEASQKYPDLDYELVRSKGFEALESYEDLQALKRQANDYKDITAPVAAHLSDIIQKNEEEKGTWKEYNEETLNNLVATGEFPSGTREWLEQRQAGIGGSDVGKIIGAYEAYASRDYESVLASKLEPISEEEVERQSGGHSEFVGATGRGNAWEQLIAHQYAQNNPDENVTYCKASWKNKENDYQFANFDGLMTDAEGRPNGILEIKTASDATKWGRTEDGLDGVPGGYRAQVLWYAQAAGVDKGAVAVIIDDHDYREYHFTMTPELRAEAASNLQRVDEFVNEVAARKNGTFIEKEKPSNKGFGKRALTGTGKDSDDYAFREASVYREESVEKTRARFNQLCKDNSDETQVRDALTQLYVEKKSNSRKSKIIAIDLETTGTSPTTGRIIEVGISVRKPEGGEEEKYSKLYGIPKKALDGNGTGAVNVHGITAGKIAKKRQFSHSVVQKEVLEKLKSGILLAHNASFEVRWLRQHLKGFAEAERRGEIKVLDTMSLSRRFVSETANNKLKSFVEHFGVPYANAHRAYNDAEMMAVGYERLQEKIQALGKDKAK